MRDDTTPPPMSSEEINRPLDGFEDRCTQRVLRDDAAAERFIWVSAAIAIGQKASAEARLTMSKPAAPADLTPNAKSNSASSRPEDIFPVGSQTCSSDTSFQTVSSGQLRPIVDSQTVPNSEFDVETGKIPDLEGVAYSETPNRDSNTNSSAISGVSTLSLAKPKLSGNDLTADEARRARSAWLVAQSTHTPLNAFLTINISAFPGYRSEKDIKDISDKAFKTLTNYFQETRRPPSYIAVAERPLAGGNGYHWHVLLGLDPNHLDKECAVLDDRFRKQCRIARADWNNAKERNFRDGGVTRLPVHFQTGTRANEDRHRLEPYERRRALSEAEAETKLAYMLKTLSGAVPIAIGGHQMALADHRANPANKLPSYHPSARRPGRRVRVTQNLDRAAASAVGVTPEEEFGWLDSAQRARRAGRTAPPRPDETAETTVRSTLLKCLNRPQVV